MLALLLPLLSLAAPAGHYHPDEVTAHSDLFQRAAEAAGRTLSARQARLKAVAAGLEHWETGLDLLGDRAGPGAWTAWNRHETRFQQQRSAVQRTFEEVSSGFEEAFEAGLDRALAGHPGREQECRSELPAGPALPGLPSRTKPNPACAGDDLNDTLAAALDADPVLQQAVDDLLARTWPEVTLPDPGSEPVGDGVQTLDVTRFVRAVAGDRLQAIDREEAEALLPLEAALEQDDSPAAAREVLAEADAVDARFARRRAALAQPILEAAEQLLGRANAATAWCAVPQTFGACGLPDVSEERIPELADHARVRRAAR